MRFGARSIAVAGTKLRRSTQGWRSGIPNATPPGVCTGGATGSHSTLVDQKGSLVLLAIWASSHDSALSTSKA